MTEKEAIKIVKKKNRQNRIENIKCWFSDYSLPVFVFGLIFITVLAFITWPFALVCFYYKDGIPTWLNILGPIWGGIWFGGSSIVIVVYALVVHIKEKKAKFRELVQEELRIDHKGKLAPKIEQWLSDHGYRDIDRYDIVYIYLDNYRNSADIAYKDKYCSPPDINQFIHIDLDREEEIVND